MDDQTVDALLGPFEAWLRHPSSTYSPATAYAYVSTMRRLLQTADSTDTAGLAAASAKLSFAFQSRSGAALRQFTRFQQSAVSVLDGEAAAQAGQIAVAVAALVKPSPVRADKKPKKPTLPRNVAKTLYAFAKLIESPIRVQRQFEKKRRPSHNHPAYREMGQASIDPQTVTEWDVIAVCTWDNIQRLPEPNTGLVRLPCMCTCSIPLDTIHPLLQVLMDYGEWSIDDAPNLVRPIIPKAPRSSEPYEAKDLAKLVRRSLATDEGEAAATG